MIMPPSFLSSYVNSKAADAAAVSDGHVLPVEHLLVHRELKKIHTFCQSGKVSALQNLFKILTDVDFTLKQSDSVDKETVSEKISAVKQLRVSIL